MKYFNPTYWFKLWLLSAPLFNSKSEGIYAKSIDNQNIKDWASKNTTDISLIENQELNFTNLSNNYQPYNLNETIHQTKLETSTHKHRHEKNRNRRSFYAKEQIEFFNNNFFYKFNINYDIGYIEGPVSQGIKKDTIERNIIDDWTKYAKDWNEFKKKFPQVEFINFWAEMGGDAPTVYLKKLNLSTNLNENNNWNTKLPLNINPSFWGLKFQNKVSDDYFIENWNLNPILTYKHSFLKIGHQESIIFIRIRPTDKKIMLDIHYALGSANCLKKTFLKLKFDSIRLVGEIDVNPLFSLTVGKSQQFDIWASTKERELKEKKEDPNYNENNLLNEENSFKEEFKLWLLQIKHDYIQDLININQNNEIINLKSEIDDIKSRLDKLEKSKTCLDNIFDSFKKNALSNAPSDSWNSIKENSESPLKVIIKKSGRAFATGLLTGIAKGSALGILSCVTDSLFSSRKRREIFDINNLEDKPDKRVISNEIKNITKWTDEFTNSINNEQHLPMINNSNFIKSNITSL